MVYDMLFFTYLRINSKRNIRTRMQVEQTQ